MKVILLLTIASMLSCINIAAQRTRVLIDKTNHTPVSYANVYKSEDGVTIGTISEENGRFLVDFGYKTLNITHINYESVVIEGRLAETIYLAPKIGILNEVVVRSGEPAWVRPLMKRFIRERKKRYNLGVSHFDYTYISRNVSDTSGYWFESEGKVKIENDKKKMTCRIAPEIGVIHYKDTTAGCDFSNLKRMIYNDFVDLLDEKFLKRHTFVENDAFETSDRNVVQLSFKSTKHGDGDKGLITVDTARCLIMSVKRETGLYYYGARYYDSRLAMWYGVDALAEKYPNISPYNYCVGNPVKLVDVDGRKIKGFSVNDNGEVICDESIASSDAKVQ